jgi:hypothetical protein
LKYPSTSAGILEVGLLGAGVLSSFMALSESSLVGADFFGLADAVLLCSLSIKSD